MGVERKVHDAFREEKENTTASTRPGTHWLRAMTHGDLIRAQSVTISASIVSVLDMAIAEDDKYDNSPNIWRRCGGAEGGRAAEEIFLRETYPRRGNDMKRGRIARNLLRMGT